MNQFSFSGLFASTGIQGIAAIVVVLLVAIAFVWGAGRQGKGNEYGSEAHRDRERDAQRKRDEQRRADTIRADQDRRREDARREQERRDREQRQRDDRRAEELRRRR